MVQNGIKQLRLTIGVSQLLTLIHSLLHTSTTYILHACRMYSIKNILRQIVLNRKSLNSASFSLIFQSCNLIKVNLIVYSTYKLQITYFN